MIPPEEARHLRSGPRCGECVGGVGLAEVVAIGCDPTLLLKRCRFVLSLVVDRQVGDWPELSEWRELLPGWFVEACLDESPAAAERWLEWWRTLPPGEQSEAERARAWSLPDWLYWLEPDERQWFWWDAAVEGEDMLRVRVEVLGWPAPLGALGWLLRAAGAGDVVIEDELAV